MKNEIFYGDAVALNWADATERVPPGAAVRVQLSPFGEFALRDGGRRSGTMQRCSRAAFEAMVANWKAAGERDILVDVDHASATGGSTEAAAWARNLRVEDDGLCADFGDALYNEAVRRGYLKAKTAMFTSDGTDWICEMAGRRFKGAVRIVDFFHACEHLSALCEVIQ